MRVPSNLRRGRFGFNMTPMIDVVFLLIIFFLVSSHLARQESQMPLPLPTAQTGNRAGDDESPRVVVNVDGSGKITVFGRTVDATQLTEVLAMSAEKSGKSLQVRIRCDRRVPYASVEPVLLASARTGIWNVTFAVVQPGRS